MSDRTGKVKPKKYKPISLPTEALTDMSSLQVAVENIWECIIFLSYPIYVSVLCIKENGDCNIETFTVYDHNSWHDDLIHENICLEIIESKPFCALLLLEQAN